MNITDLPLDILCYLCTFIPGKITKPNKRRNHIALSMLLPVFLTCKKLSRVSMCQQFWRMLLSDRDKNSQQATNWKRVCMRLYRIFLSNNLYARANNSIIGQDGFIPANDICVYMRKLDTRGCSIDFGSKQHIASISRYGGEVTGLTKGDIFDVSKTKEHRKKFSCRWWIYDGRELIPMHRGIVPLCMNSLEEVNKGRWCRHPFWCDFRNMTCRVFQRRHDDYISLGYREFGYDGEVTILNWRYYLLIMDTLSIADEMKSGPVIAVCHQIDNPQILQFFKRDKSFYFIWVIGKEERYKDWLRYARSQKYIIGNNFR